jgi:hypothetical protein
MQTFVIQSVLTIDATADFTPGKVDAVPVCVVCAMAVRPKFETQARPAIFASTFGAKTLCTLLVDIDIFIEAENQAAALALASKGETLRFNVDWSTLRTKEPGAPPPDKATRQRYDAKTDSFVFQEYDAKGGKWNDLNIFERLANVNSNSLWERWKALGERFKN